MKDKFIAVSTIASGAILVYALYKLINSYSFNAREFQINAALILILSPILIVLFIYKSDLSDFGLSPVDSVKTSRLVLLFLIVATILILIPISKMPSVRQNYPIDGFTARSGLAYLHFSALYGLYAFGWENFFRGYLLFGLRKSIGWGAIFVQSAVAAVLFYGKPGYRIFVPTLFLIGIFLGWLTLRGKSILPAFLIHWISGTALNTMILGYKHFAN